MAKIRAYKLAEELGLERAEVVEKAASVGVVLKSAMATVDEEQAQVLREKLRGKPTKQLVSERRVDASGGAIIRRRRKVAEPPPPPPEPAAVATPAAPETQPPAVAAESELLPEPAPEPGAPLGAAPEPAPQVDSQAQAPAPVAARTGDDRSSAPSDKAGRQRKLVREVVNLREQERLARQATSRGPMRRQVTLQPRSVTSPRRRRRDTPVVAAAGHRPPKEGKRALRIEGTVSVGELARLLGAKAPEIQRKLMALGTMVSVNQAVGVEVARQVSTEFGYEVQDVGFREEEFLAAAPAEGSEGAREPRPPVVTVMGHVDHGKTSLLDALRNSDVVSSEAGNITQHVGAYQVTTGGKTITFIDTPGHEAFTAMRARGARVTDLVILVVAASEGIIPQTIEAIDHAKAAGVPIVVAVNKIDLPNANPQQTRQRLLEHGLVPEEFGGETLCVDISATKRTNLDKLLEAVLLQAELLELTADPKCRTKGVVIEARLEKGRGPVATLLVQEGTLTRGDVLVVGTEWGRVRALEDEAGKRRSEAGPATPVQVTGLSGVPEAGQAAHVVESDRVAKDIVEHRIAERRSGPVETRPRVSLDEFFAQAEGGGVRELALLVKGDVQGSIEALRDALLKLSTDAVKVEMIHTGVGAINESDVMLARASNAIIIGFHVRPDPAARRAAESQGVDVRVYRVIFEASDDVRKAMAGLLPPTVTENVMGRAEVRETFTVPRVGTIAGSYVAEGNVRRGGMCRLLRDGVQIYEGRVGSLKRFKDDAREVATGFECGIGIDGYNDIKVGDVIELYEREERPATL